MTKLFNKIPDEQRKSKSILIRVNADEASKIRHAADIRNIFVSDFIRRAALGRRADVHYETQIVLALRDFVASIKALHAALVERGITPPEDEWRPIIKEAVAAMLRISK